VSRISKSEHQTYVGPNKLKAKTCSICATKGSHTLHDDQSIVSEIIWTKKSTRAHLSGNSRYHKISKNFFEESIFMKGVNHNKVWAATLPPGMIPVPPTIPAAVLATKLP
jgi:hypothetical protein